MKIDFGKLVKSAERTITKNAPELLTIMGVGALLYSVYRAVKDDTLPKAKELVAKTEEEKGEPLTKVETVKAAYKPFVPVVVSAVTGVACIAGASHINHARNASLAGAYAVAQQVIKKYEDKTVELAGEEKAKEIKTEVEKEVSQMPEVQKKVSKMPKKTDEDLVPYWDPFSNTPFYANEMILDKVAAKLNKELYSSVNGYVTLTDLYDALDDCGAYPRIEPTSVSDNFGWSSETGNIMFAAPEYREWNDGTPCRVLSFAFGHRPHFM